MAAGGSDSARSSQTGGHFGLSALSGRINSAQFHSLNSAFPGQSQAFTEFSAHTLNTRTKAPPPPKPVKPPFHPLFTLLQFQQSLSKRSQNSALLWARQEAEEGGEARATPGHCCSYSFSTATHNCNFLHSVRNVAAGRRPVNTQTA